MSDDLDRIRTEYTAREDRLSGSDIYSPFNLAYLFSIQQRQRIVLPLLRRMGFYPLEERVILELGCGRGGVLLDFLRYGANPRESHGCDLLPDQLLKAKTRLPHLPILCADGQSVPYPDSVFDLVLQYTVFSSILDGKVKARLAREMMRVLKPGGMILWYDFWLNPTNLHTQGIRPKEIRKLFPECDYEFHRITLAPPIARRVVRYSWLLALILEKLVFLNSHYLVAIQPQLKYFNVSSSNPYPILPA